MATFTAGGGGREVTGSFYLYSEGDTTLAIDCGLREEKDRYLVREKLPDFDLVKKIDGIVLSHGHNDHIGAIPFFVKKFGEVPLYMTAATKEIAGMQWKEGRRHCSWGADASYDIDDIVKCLSLAREIRPHEPFAVGKMNILPIPAGHILGAQSFVITLPDGKRIFHSGDISFKEQYTTSGADLGDLEADVLVSESTCAGKATYSREDEEKRCLASIKAVISNNGQVLMPAFSIGRATEDFEILRRSGFLVGEVLIGIDGAAVANSKIYSRHAPEKIDPYIKSFYLEKDKDRRAMLRHKPAIVIAPSGMLHGGRAIFYLREWLEVPENAIFFTGFQSCTSPGRKLLGTKHGDLFEFENEYGEEESKRKMCKVESFDFSAHASGDELLAMREKLKPKKTILTHGDKKGMDQMIKKHSSAESVIEAPENGEEIQL